MHNDQTRRTVLRAGATVGGLTLAGALAGCSSPGGENGDENGEGDDENGENSGEGDEGNGEDNGENGDEE
jgi:hypothetical protein